MLLQKWLTLSYKYSLSPECLKKPCENLDKQHINILLHTEFRWLNRGSLNRPLELEG
jgi:hypothetical protein